MALSDSETKALHHLVSQKTQILKFGHRGEPQFRDFWLGTELKTIKWDSKTKSSKKTMLKIKDIVKLEIGQKTSKFKKHNRQDLRHLSFSVIFRNGIQKDSLDLVCKERSDFNYWTVALQVLVDKKVDLSAIAKDDFPSTPQESKSKPSHLRKQTTLRDVNATKEKKKKWHAAFEGANDVYSFGWNEWGQLGVGSLTNENVPTLSQPLLGIGVNQVACGWSHASVLLASNAVLQFGNRVGTGFKEDLVKPRVVSFPNNPKIAGVSCGDYHSVALSDGGQVYTWGCNSFGQLGHGNLEDLDEPKPVETLKDCQVIQVECGSNGTAAIDYEGSVYTWGSGANGFLGHNSTDDELAPRLVTDLQGCTVVNIACGDAHIVAVTERQAFVWGWNGCGQLGLGHRTDQLRPFPLVISNNGTVDWIACGGAHSCAIVCTPAPSLKRQIYVWGSNRSGQLGFPINIDHSARPSTVPSLPSAASQVECGSAHTCVLTTENEVLTAGSNLYGERGLGSAYDPEKAGFTLVKGASDKQIRGIACGGSQTCALAPRAWVNDEEVFNCMAPRCGAAFTIVNRRHHCRNCGGIFCNQCSSKTIAILAYDYKEPVRVCDKCYKQLYNAKFE